MKKVTALVLGLFLFGFTAKAAENISVESTINFYDGKSYIFVEGGVEFSVFPDGQFDFVYVGNQGGNVNVNINTPNASVSFNSGYDYDMYVQYDDYGAVIQIENVPIYYDNFGRIIQAGDVEIRYNNRRIVRVGGLNIFYNSYGYFDYCTGFISPWYRTYVYRPWHVFYVRPIYANCIVYDYPYRRWYSPVRYGFAYHRNYYHRGRRFYANARRDFYRPGSRVHYRDGRVARNRSYNPNRVNTAYTRGDRGDRNGSRFDGTTRPVTRGIAKKDDKFSNNSRPNTTRGIAKKDNKLDRNTRPNTTRGIAKKDNKLDRNTRPNTTRGIAKKDNKFDRNTRPTTRGIAKKDNKFARNTKPVTRGIAKKDSRFSGNKNSSFKRSGRTTSKGTFSKSRSNGSKPMARTQKKSNRSFMNKSSSSNRNKGSFKKSSNSRSKSSMSRKSSNSRSRGSAPKRGRGL